MSSLPDRISNSTVERADDLAAFAFDPGAAFVRWVDYRDARADDTVWVVVGRSFHYDVSWERDESNTRPTDERHRHYTLCARTTNERQTVSEATLHRHDWRHWQEGRR